MDKWQPGKPDYDGKQLTASGAGDKHFALSFGPIERGLCNTDDSRLQGY
jgi:hypothetical protein